MLPKSSQPGHRKMTRPRMGSRKAAQVNGESSAPQVLYSCVVYYCFLNIFLRVTLQKIPIVSFMMTK